MTKSIVNDCCFHYRISKSLQNTRFHTQNVQKYHFIIERIICADIRICYTELDKYSNSSIFSNLQFLFSRLHNTRNQKIFHHVSATIYVIVLWNFPQSVLHALDKCKQNRAHDTFCVRKCFIIVIKILFNGQQNP